MKFLKKKAAVFLNIHYLKHPLAVIMKMRQYPGAIRKLIQQLTKELKILLLMGNPMNSQFIILPVLLIIITSCTNYAPSKKLLTRFNVEKDLYLAHFDCKTDVDDIHSAAGVKTILNDPRFSEVKYHAVSGAYGIQEGLYVPANDLFEFAFGDHWSDAHNNFEQALDEVTSIAYNTLNNGGNVWIAEGGQSDFSASLLQNIKNKIPSVITNSRVHIVQHSGWNESQTSPDKLAYIKGNAEYIKIPDGNVIGNGSPGFYTEAEVNWRKYITDPNLINVWEKAFEIADKYNGRDGRHNNPAIAMGGMDFSDVSETCWIFGFNHLKNAEEFFKEFASSKNE